MPIGRGPTVIAFDDEGELIENGAADPPIGLQEAIAFFLVAAAAQNLADSASARAPGI